MEEMRLLEGMGLSPKSDWLDLFSALLQQQAKELRVLGKMFKKAGYITGAVSKATKTSLADRIAQAIPSVYHKVDSGAHDVPEFAHVDEDGEEQPGLKRIKQEVPVTTETIVINGVAAEIEKPLDDGYVHQHGRILGLEDDSPEGQLGMQELVNRQFNVHPESLDGVNLKAIGGSAAQGMADAHEGSEMSYREYLQQMWEIADWHCPKDPKARAKGKDWELGRWLATNKELVEAVKAAKTRQDRLYVWALFTLRGRKFYRDIGTYYRVQNAIKAGQRALIGMKAQDYWAARKSGKDPVREVAILAWRNPAQYSTK